MSSLIVATLILIFSTSFVKVLACLSIFQYGLGLKNFAFSIVIFVFSIVTSIYLTDPIVSNAGGWDDLLSVDTEKKPTQIIEVQQKYFASYLEEKADPEVVQSLDSTANPQLTNLVAFFLTELKTAFYIGLLFIIPFVVIDLLVTNILMALGVTQLSSFAIALPAKILLFYLADGWSLLFEKILIL